MGISRQWQLTGDLGVELNAVNGVSLVGDGSVLRVLGHANGVEALGQVAELVTVRHPNSHGILQTLEQSVDMSSEAGGLQLSVTVFSGGTGDDVVGVDTVGDLLQTVADTENGDTEFEEGGVNVGSTVLVDGVRATGEDDTLGLPAQIGELLGAGQHLGVDIDFS